MLTTEFAQEITERLPVPELCKKLKELQARIDREYGTGARHVESDGEYVILNVGVININGTSYYSVVYTPAELYDDLWNTLEHSRPVHEFFDGRFEHYFREDED